MGARRLSIEQEKQLVQEFLNGTPVKQLCEKYGYKTKKSITDKVKKYSENYQEALEIAKQNRKEWSYSFKTIKNDFDAYFIGLLMTDGYLTSRGSDIGLDLIDEDCISFISKTIGKEYKTYNEQKNREDGYTRQPRHRMILSGKEIVSEAARYGIIKNKTNILSEFQLEREEEIFIPYLVRGIIDGDGCIYKTSYGAPALYIISKSQSFVEWVKKLMEEKLFFKHLKINSTENGLYKIETANQTDILKLIALVYDEPFGMSRKYNFLRQTFRDYNRK